MDVETLMGRALAGDLDARNELGRWLFELLQGFFCARFSEADADELRQRSSLIVLNKLHTFEARGPGSLRWWTLKIASFEAKVMLREPGRELGRRRMLAERPLSSTLSPASVILELERHARLGDYLALLPVQERTAIEHGLAEGEDRELAEREGITVAAVRSRRFRGRQRLGELLLAAEEMPRLETTSSSKTS